ncbi:hypothetical protein BKN37_18795 [Mycobacterium talmoniae]|uniref:Uncharacterized protein n=1 Tax=Mycobacterium talmoniae TaxID=1858794 RepID=A0A1S1NIS4_9MYCO|nr:hypothetical protein BKN37_18795 [Mycobacterium talmoniae]
MLTTLHQRSDQDSYHGSDVAQLFDDGPAVVRARWRWYTIDMLGLVAHDASETARASVHRAVKTLAQRRVIDTVTAAYPYAEPFTGYLTAHGERAGHIDLAELHDLDPCWPARHGRRLWFRLPPPARRIPHDDQIAVLGRLDAHRPDEFEDFVAAVDRRRAWTTPVGHFVAWLLRGQPGQPREGSRTPTNTKVTNSTSS